MLKAIGDVFSNISKKVSGIKLGFLTYIKNLKLLGNGIKKYLKKPIN